jgi:NADH-quinone oxidoreductase subunit J
MTLYGAIFYILGGVVVVSTGFAVTRRNLAHAIVYLVISFFGSAMLFYLLGAPLLAALEVIIYAGAIMILFLFIVMMIQVEGAEETLLPRAQLFPALGLAAVYGVVGILLLAASDSSQGDPLRAAVAHPADFGEYLFRHHWLSIELASMLLLVAVVGALLLGKDRARNGSGEK